MSLINNAHGDTIETRLRHLGASSIKKINGILYFIEFDIDDDLKISYTYNINTQNKYFLQRIEPYPLPQGVFDKEYEVVSFIEKDLLKFSNAKKSHNFDLFLSITNGLNDMFVSMEKLFLNYNIDKADLEKLYNDIDDFYSIIQESKKRSPKIELDKK